jgi:ADP-ribosylglycohydrolase
MPSSKHNPVIGAIIGDIVGSIYEWDNIKTTEFPLFQGHCHFTDDTVLTIALADSILSGKPYKEVMLDYFARYPDAGYGGSFRKFAIGAIDAPYSSYGNGSAMRTSPVGCVTNSLEEALRRAEEYAAVTHNHSEGVKGAQAVAGAICLARLGCDKELIRNYTQDAFRYNLSRTCDSIRPGYTFDVSCQGTVPEAIIAFLDSNNFEHAIRLAVSLGGDSDTLACITGSIAGAYYGVPNDLAEKAKTYLDPELVGVLEEFEARYIL